jgi:hypothetical protein
MTPRYQVSITNKEARQFLRMYFDGVRIPHGSKTLWVAGLQYISDQPGLYLTAGAGGMCGVLVLPKAKEGSVAA